MHNALSHFDSSGQLPIRRNRFPLGICPPAEYRPSGRTDSKKWTMKSNFEPKESIIKELFKHFATERGKKRSNILSGFDS